MEFNSYSDWMANKAIYIYIRDLFHSNHKVGQNENLSAALLAILFNKLQRNHRLYKTITLMWI